MDIEQITKRIIATSIVITFLAIVATVLTIRYSVPDDLGYTYSGRWGTTRTHTEHVLISCTTMHFTTTTIKETTTLAQTTVTEKISEIQTEVSTTIEESTTVEQTEEVIEETLESESFKFDFLIKL